MLVTINIFLKKKEKNCFLVVNKANSYKILKLKNDYLRNAYIKNKLTCEEKDRRFF